MCGIAGLVVTEASGREVARDSVIRMRDVLRHRGPDEDGIFVDRFAGLAHRRLSIVDLATGQQPMFNEDEQLVIVYNGEVYNHSDYRQDLEAKGHRYRSHCDTETILHLFEEHGEACVDCLRGMFAFAIWHRGRRELFIARDRLGIKPLYYVHTDDGSLFFASEIKALVEAGAVKPSLNVAALPDYLANHATCGESTLYEGVKRLLPGHTLTWKDGKVRIREFWDVPFGQPQVTGKSDSTYLDEWADMFKTAVRLRLMADVPLGMFLSGGIDSSAIAATMSQLVKDPIKTFSVAFAEREANELAYARIVADAFRTDHHEVIVSPDQFFGALPGLVWHEDEPIAHPSSVALYFVSQLAVRYVKVVLTGEGSDELLAGYARYHKTLLNLRYGQAYERLPAAVRSAGKAATALLPLKLRNKAARTFVHLPATVESLYFDNFAVFGANAQPRLLSASTRAAVGDVSPYVGMRHYFDRQGDATLLGRLLYADLKTYLHELLMKQDQMSMAASLESRVPFLDHKLVEYTATMPEHLKLNGSTTKYVLRESMKGILPDAILTRGKMGFPVPVGRWFNTSHRSLIDEYVLSPRVFERGLFDPSYVKALVAEHQAGQRNHDERLWSLVNFEVWMRTCIDRDLVPAVLPDVPESPRS